MFRQALILFLSMSDQEIFPFNPHETEGKEFVGEAVLSEGFNVKDIHLDQLLGLDRDRWQIVGIHALPATGYYSPSSTTILAVDKNTEYRDGDVVDVVKFSTDLTFEDVMRCMKSASIFFTKPGLQGSKFNVVEEQELKKKDM